MQALYHKLPPSCPCPYYLSLVTFLKPLLHTTARWIPPKMSLFSSLPCSKSYQVSPLHQLKVSMDNIHHNPADCLSYGTSLIVPWPLHSGHTGPLCSVNTKGYDSSGCIGPVTSWDYPGLCLPHFPTSAGLVPMLQPPRSFP